MTSMLAYLNISVKRKKMTRCFFLPFSSGFSRTLRTLQLWLVSLPGQGLGWRWDLGGRALMDRRVRSQVSILATSAGPWNSCNA